jgi:hypothetical protein
VQVDEAHGRRWQPVFDGAWQLISVHHAGDSTSHGCVTRAALRGNAAISLPAIKADVHTLRT